MLSKLVVILSLFIMILSMSVVSAEDLSNDTTDNDNVQVLNDVAINDFTGLDNAIQQANNNGIINLNSNITKQEEEFNNYTFGISIEKNITINGNGYTIDGNYNGRIFSVTNNSTLILNNITFINGNAANIGEGNFNNNGGVIANEGGSRVIIDSSVFRNNQAQIGGAIDNGGYLTINNSIFINNIGVNGYFGSQGGAIESYSEFSETIINNTRFINNIADDGGALYIATGLASINNSYFDNNLANYSGAINVGANVFVENSIFTNNQATHGGAIALDYGAIYFKGTNYFINNSVTPNGNGGAIYNPYGNTIDMMGTNIFINNSAAFGGAIFNDVFSNFAYDGYSIFINNSASEIGGAIYNGGTITGISNATFINNSANYGGAISNYDYNYGYGHVGNIEDCIFENNIANIIGGAIYNADTMETITNTTFKNNNATGGKDIYNGGSINDSFKVYIETNQSIFQYGQTINLLANVTLGNATVNGGNLIFVINGREYEGIPLDSDLFIITYTANQSSGNISIYAIYNGDYSNNITLTFTKANPNLEYNITKTDNETNVLIKTNVEGSVLIVVDNQYYEILEVENGEINFNLTPQNSEILVIFNGNENYDSYSQVIKLTDLIDTNIIANDLTKYFHNSSTYQLTLVDSNGNPIANEIVKITINGVTYNRTTDENGLISFNINLAPGVYRIAVNYTGSDSYNPSSSENTVTVLSTIEADDIVKYYLNETQYFAAFVDENGNPLANVNVSFNINGVIYNRVTDENGIARLNINLNPGEYIITARNPLNGQMYSNTVTVLPTLQADNLIMYYQNGSRYEVTVLDKNGNPLANSDVSLNINGVIYNRVTDENGIARLNINLNPGEYIITATSETGLRNSNIITVLPVITAEDTQINHGMGETYNVSLVDGKGNPLADTPVTININGVIYNRLTDNEGIARLTINLNPGQYVATANYGTAAVSNLITVI